jgi:hypothetical protein
MLHYFLILIFSIPAVYVSAQNSTVSIDPSTGTAHVYLPLYNIPAPDGSVIPVGLNYETKGIQVAELASDVGLGWNLWAGGSIVRVVKGIPDTGGNFLRPTSKQELKDFLNNKKDGERDVYYFNYPGGSGKFIIAEENGVKKYYSLPYNDIKISQIQPSLGYSGPTYFQIIDTKGVKYIFGKRVEEQGMAPYSSHELHTVNDKTSTNVWKLVEIIYPNVPASKSIKFKYGITTQYNDSWKDYITPFEVNGSAWAMRTYTTNVTYLTRKLTEIDFGSGKVKFSYGNAREDVLGDRPLNKVVVTSDNGNAALTYDFLQSYFDASDSFFKEENFGPCTGPECKRLKLEGIKKNGSLIETYSYWNDFDIHTYQKQVGNQTVTVSYDRYELPPRDSHYKDVHGYFNGGMHQGTDYGPMPKVWMNGGHFGGIDFKAPNSLFKEPTDAVKANSLRKIQHSLGGYTEFEYSWVPWEVGYGGLFLKNYKTMNEIGDLIAGEEVIMRHIGFFINYWISHCFYNQRTLNSGYAGNRFYLQSFSTFGLNNKYEHKYLLGCHTRNLITGVLQEQNFNVVDFTQIPTRDSPGSFSGGQYQDGSTSRKLFVQWDKDDNRIDILDTLSFGYSYNQNWISGHLFDKDGPNFQSNIKFNYPISRVVRNNDGRIISETNWTFLRGDEIKRLPNIYFEFITEDRDYNWFGKKIDHDISYYFIEYDVIYIPVRLDKIIEIRHDYSKGSQPISVTSETSFNSYSSVTPSIPSIMTSVAPDGTQDITTYRYVTDLSLSNDNETSTEREGYVRMKQFNMVGVPVETYTVRTRDGQQTLLGASLQTFKTNGGQVVPYKSYGLLPGAGTGSLNVDIVQGNVNLGNYEFLGEQAYDASTGNLLSVTDKTGVQTSYEYYANNLLWKETVNTGQRQLVTEYEHYPLIGIKSVKDPNGYKIGYEYDEQNRLRLIREIAKDANGNDVAGNILKRYRYHTVGDDYMFSSNLTAQGYGMVGSEITFTSNNSASFYGQTKYTWDFGDGTVKETFVPHVKHSFNSGGPKNVMLTMQNPEYPEAKKYGRSVSINSWEFSATLEGNSPVNKCNQNLPNPLLAFVSSSGAMCIGETNLNYTWERSTDGYDWQPVPGAINVPYIGLQSGTWYIGTYYVRCLVYSNTCPQINFMTNSVEVEIICDSGGGGGGQFPTIE